MKKPTNESMSLFDCIRKYLTVYLPAQRGVSANTTDSYSTTLTQFFDHIAGKAGKSLTVLTWNDVTRGAVESFLCDGEERHGWSPSTRNQKLAAIKSFLKYSSDCDIAVVAIYQSVSNIPVKKCGKKPVDFFSEAALKAILAEPDTNTRKGVRDLTLMIVLYDTAARVQELLDLRIRDLNLDGKSPSITLKGKGEKSRIVPLMIKTAERLENYIEAFHDGGSDDDFLFYVEHRNGRRSVKTQMSQDNVARLINEYAGRAREKCPEVPEHIYPHMFRHSRAMHLYRNGMPLPLVSEFLGHANMETTIRFYANADVDMKRTEIEKATADLTPLLDSEFDFVIPDNEEVYRKLCGLK